MQNNKTYFGLYPVNSGITLREYFEDIVSKSYIKNVYKDYRMALCPEAFCMDVPLADDVKLDYSDIMFCSSINKGLDYKVSKLEDGALISYIDLEKIAKFKSDYYTDVRLALCPFRIMVDKKTRTLLVDMVANDIIQVIDVPELYRGERDIRWVHTDLTDLSIFTGKSDRIKDMIRSTNILPFPWFTTYRKDK